MEVRGGDILRRFAEEILDTTLLLSQLTDLLGRSELTDLPKLFVCSLPFTVGLVIQIFFPRVFCPLCTYWAVEKEGGARGESKAAG